MGKWNEALADKPKVLGTDEDYQQKVEARKREIQQFPDFKQYASHLAKLYVAARERKNEVKELEYDANLTLTAVEQMLADQFEVEDSTSLKLETGESVRVQVEPYIQVQNRDAYREWCIAMGFQDKMMMPPSTTTAIGKEHLGNGEALPPGLAVFAKNKVVMSGA